MRPGTLPSHLMCRELFELGGSTWHSRRRSVWDRRCFAESSPRMTVNRLTFLSSETTGLSSSMNTLDSGSKKNGVYTGSNPMNDPLNADRTRPEKASTSLALDGETRSSLWNRVIATIESYLQNVEHLPVS